MEEEVEDNSRRELISIIPTGKSDFIPVYKVDFSNPAELLKFKLSNSMLSDIEWIVAAAISGVAHSWNHEFQDWVRLKRELGQFPEIPPAVKAPGRFREVYFGEVGRAGYNATKEDWGAFTEFMLGEDWPVDNLGKFGEWVKESKLDQKYIKDVLGEFLED